MKKTVLMFIGGGAIVMLSACEKAAAPQPPPPAAVAAPTPVAPVAVLYYGYVGTPNGPGFTNPHRVMVLATSLQQADALFRQQYGRSFCGQISLEK